MTLYTYSRYITTHTGKRRVSNLSLNWTKGTEQFHWLCLLQYYIANKTLKFTKEFGEINLCYSSCEWAIIKMKNAQRIEFSRPSSCQMLLHSPRLSKTNTLHACCQLNKNCSRMKTSNYLKGVSSGWWVTKQFEFIIEIEETCEYLLSTK